MWLYDYFRNPKRTYLLSLYQKKIPCSQRYIKEENLAEQISKILQKVSLPNSWTKKMIAKLDEEKEVSIRADFSFAQNLKFQIREYEEKLDKLLDLQLSGAISTEEYTQKKQKILNQKIEISEKLRDFEKNENGWLERARNFILTSNGAKIIAHQDNLQKKREFLQKVGSNIVLADQNTRKFGQFCRRAAKRRGGNKREFFRTS